MNPTPTRPEAPKHTPGPWRNIGRAIVTKDARIEIAVASTNDTKDAHVNENHRVMWEEAAANARLIAAAPAMLEALQRLCDSLAWEENRSGTTFSGYESAKAAIRAATGEE